MKNKTRVRLKPGILLLAALGLGQTAGVYAEPARVTETRVEARDWTQVLSLNGTLTSARDARLTPRVGGLVTEVKVDAGSRVAAGDVLFRLDQTLDALQLRELQAQLDAARGELQEAIRLRDENLPLAEKGLVPTTEAEASKARAQIRTAEVARLQAEIKRQQERIRRHRIVAPFAGVISRRHAEVGEWVDTGTPVADLVATDTLRLDIQVPQQYFGLLKKGTPVTVQANGQDHTELQAEVSVRVPVSDPTARTFLVRIDLDNKNGNLAPGMSAQANFRILTGEKVLAVPRDATLRYPDGTVRIWLITGKDGEHTVAAKQVKLGRSSEGMVEIREGVKVGDRIVLRGNEALSNGDRVQIVEGK